MKLSLRSSRRSSTEETGKYVWIAGERFGEEIPVQTLLLDPSYGRRMADFFDTTIPLMSDRLLTSLEEVGVNNIDKYPMVLLHPSTGKTWRNYKAVNVVGKIDAVDLAASEFVTGATGIRNFRRVVLDTDCIHEQVLFRLADGPGFIVVHESIKKILEPRGFVALLFQKVESYRGI